MKDNFIRGCVAGFLSIFAYLSGKFTPLILVLVIFMMIDYISGIISAIMSSEGLSSEIALKSIVRKLCYFLLVAVAFLFDFMISETTAFMNFDLAWTGVFGMFTLCYLISGEGISVLENLSEIGICVPFLTDALKKFKSKVSDSAK